jgi:hypothetical protein
MTSMKAKCRQRERIQRVYLMKGSLAMRSPRKARSRVKAAEWRRLCPRVVSHGHSPDPVDVHVEEVVVPPLVVLAAQEDAVEGGAEHEGGAVGGSLSAYRSATEKMVTRRKQRRDSRMVDRSCGSEGNYTSSRVTSLLRTRTRKVTRRLTRMAICLEVRICLVCTLSTTYDISILVEHDVDHPGRKFKCHTFVLPERHPSRQYMLAIDAARASGFRDSLYFFRRNPLALKLSAIQPEKEFLIASGKLGAHLKTRSVTLVTARSAYKLHGAKMILGTFLLFF